MTQNNRCNPFFDIDIKEIVPNLFTGLFFFMAWRLKGSTTTFKVFAIVWFVQGGMVDEKRKAEEPSMLICTGNAPTFLRMKNSNHQCCGGYFIRIPTTILIKKITIPTLRQQVPSTDGFCYSLADFSETSGRFVGVLPNTVLGVEAFARNIRKGR